MTGEKVASIISKDESEASKGSYIAMTTNELNLKNCDIEIANNLIKIKLKDEIVYELKYILDDNEIEISTSATTEEMTNFINITVFMSNEYIFYTTFVAYVELLGVNPNEAMKYTQLVTLNDCLISANANRVGTSTKIDNEIMYFKSGNTENTRTYILKVKNNLISRFDELIENERKKLENIIDEIEQPMTDEQNQALVTMIDKRSIIKEMTNAYLTTTN